MHPPLLKSTAGGRRKNRMKSALEGGSSSKRSGAEGGTEEGTGKRRHKCPICLDFGHHWHKCHKGNSEDIAAMERER